MSAPVISIWMPIRRKNNALLYWPLGSTSENLCAEMRRENAEHRNKKVRMSDDAL